jgi:hypothetical protein
MEAQKDNHRQAEKEYIVTGKETELTLLLQAFFIFNR